MNKIVFEVQDELRKLSNSLTVEERQQLIISINHDFQVITEKGVTTVDYHTKYFDIYQKYRAIMTKLFIRWDEAWECRKDACDFYELQNIDPEANIHEALLHYITDCTPRLQIKASDEN